MSKESHLDLARFLITRIPVSNAQQPTMMETIPYGRYSNVNGTRVPIVCARGKMMAELPMTISAMASTRDALRRLGGSEPELVEEEVIGRG